MRVLNLIDQPGAVGETVVMRLSLGAANAGPQDEDHAWLLLGGEPMRDAAQSAGIDPARVRLMPVPNGVRWVVPGANRRLMALLDQADRIDCWTQGAAELATRLGCSHAIPRFGQATLCRSAKQLIDEASHHSPPSREVPEEVAESSIASPGDRAALRDRWHATDDTIIVALLADRPDRVDAREAFLATAFTFETLAAAKAEHGGIRLLCHPLTRRRVEGDTLGELLGQPQLVLQDPAVLCPWRTLPACDLALAPDPTHAGLSILWADALGVPIIAPPEPRLDLLGELEHMRPTSSNVAKHLAYRMTEWAFGHSSIPAC